MPSSNNGAAPDPVVPEAPARVLIVDDDESVMLTMQAVLEMDGWVFNQGTLVPWYAGNGHWWQLITSGFLHIGIIHLAVNMLSLYMIGPTLERFVGRIRFLVIYLTATHPTCDFRGGAKVPSYLRLPVVGRTVICP